MIGLAIQKAEWKFGSGSTVHGRRFDDGVVVSVARSSPLWKAGAELVSYVRANRAEATLRDDGNAPAEKVLIQVGSKRRPALLVPVLTDDEREALAKKDRERSEEFERFRKEWCFPPYEN